MNIETIYSKPALRVTLHALFWLGLMSVQYYMKEISFNTDKFVPIVNELILAGTVRIMLFYYPLVYWVLPVFFYRKRYIAGILLTFLLIVSYAVTDALVEEWMIKPCASCLAAIDNGRTGYVPFLKMPMPNRVLSKTLSFGVAFGVLFNIALPLSIKMGLQAFRQQLRAMRLSKENLQLEFNFLRSQVNPHFLFNTLNNIYGLILKDNKERSAETVARLSQFLRYSLYESNSERVPVEKEIQLLKDYVALESLRLNHIQVELNYSTDDSIPMMAPLLLIPLIENSFKHTKDEPGAFIRIDVQVKDEHINFTSINSRGAINAEGGIGLNNVKKRMELYYPKRHTFTVHNAANQFEVAINIDCHE